jgi:serine phosphatase RsbU (regulator of sigma subunit)
MNSNSETEYKGNILLVDDLPENLQLLSSLLLKVGYTVRSVTSGRMALKTLQVKHPDVIILDIKMPDMDGYQVCKFIKNDKKLCNIPVIFISALDDIFDKVTAFKLGAIDYITKPFEVEEVLARLENQLTIQRQQRFLEQEIVKRKEAEQVLHQSQALLAQANQEISTFNEILKKDNLRMSAELEIVRKLQQMVLPKQSELDAIEDLEIAIFMEPANEVSGDYYDVLKQDGKVKISIGDVTGHGLESGVLMIMVQTAIRTLEKMKESDPVKFLNIVNQTIYDNLERMKSDKTMTLTILDYAQGVIKLTGQHEKIIVIRGDGRLECINTIDLGFPIGLEPEISNFITQEEVRLNSGDMVVLYTDGITEAENTNQVLYGLERLCKVLVENYQSSATEIKQVVIDDVRQHIGTHQVSDDITLVVIKQK